MKVIATKIISFLLSVCLLISLIPTQVVHATEPNPLKETNIASSNEIANIMPMSDTDTELLTLNVSKNVQISASGELKYYKFVPSSTGFYTFKSSNITSGDPKGWIYNSNWNYMSENDDVVTGNYNFRITYHLIAGVTYYYIAGSYGSTAANYTIVVTNSSAYAPNVLSEMESQFGLVSTTAYESYTLLFEPEETKEYVFYTQRVSGDPQIWLYDSDRVLVGSNNSGTYNTLEAWLAVELEANRVYYLVVGHSQTSSGTYTTRVLREKDIESRGCAFKNDENVLYIDIHGPGEQIKVHQWSFHPNEWEAWKVEKHDNGYYTIQSAYGERKYIGASGNSTSSDKILLYDNICSDTYWKAYETPDTGFVLMPYRSVARVLIPPNDNVGTELRLAWIFEVDSDRMYWSTEPRTSAELVGQVTSQWCWAAAARMFASHYHNNLDLSVQGAVDILNDGAIQGAFESDAQAAINLYLGRINESIDTTYFENEDRVIGVGKMFSEENLIRFLDDGHVLYISRTRYIDSTTPDGGHALLVCGYTTNPVNGEKEYIIYDPMPENEITGTNFSSDPGQAYTRSYDWICNGRNAKNDEHKDISFWTGYVVPVTEYSDDSIDTIWSWEE